MKNAMFALTLIFSPGAFAAQMIVCPSFGDALNTSIQIDPVTNKATVSNKYGSKPFSVSTSPFARNHAAANEVAFEGDNLVDTGKLILFNNETGAVKFYTYDLLTYKETTIGPVNCQLQQKN